MDKEKKTLSLKPKLALNTDTDSESTVKRPNKRRVIRREDIVAERLATARPPRNAPPRRPVKKLTPAEQQAVDLTAELADNFPIWEQHKPLAIGIEEALQQHFDQVQIPVSKRVLHRVLWHHTHQKEYLQQILIENQRYSLDGQAMGEIKASEKEHAQRTLDEIALAQTPKARRPGPAKRPSPRPRY
ncbi:ProQ/FINO family protein [Thiofilum flexile]|uniref:ProQ/FINO family protein n=1 Tax=Thiofilum flexile TaxID=125627 RepID=UPI0003741BC5|nr:ProQ/FINO family protein [Thiofilum flexile]